MSPEYNGSSNRGKRNADGSNEMAFQSNESDLFSELRYIVPKVLGNGQQLKICFPMRLENGYFKFV